jgi:hypothetical protein
MPALFVLVVAAQHFLAPELAPGRHMISEYANAGFGLLMVLGLASWSASLACTAVVARSERVQSYRTTARGTAVGL